MANAQVTVASLIRYLRSEADELEEAYQAAMAGQTLRSMGGWPVNPAEAISSIVRRIKRNNANLPADGKLLLTDFVKGS